MDHTDHVNLLRGGIPQPGGVWADLGSGRGAFTLALAEIIGPAGTICSVDKDRSGLGHQAEIMSRLFPAASITYVAADFTDALDLPPLDGVVMANSLHYQRDKDAVLRHVRRWLKPGGRLILVEYNVERGNLAVPYPVSYRQWEALAARSGFVETRLLTTVPSSFLKEFYSAVSLNPAETLQPQSADIDSS